MTETRCSACLHPAVGRIEEALRAGTPMRQVARAFGVGRGVLARHREHTSQSAASVPALEDARTVLERALALTEESMNALSRAEESGRLPMILSALKSCRSSARQLRRSYAEAAASDSDRARLEILYQRAVGAYSRSVGKGQIEFSALEGLRGTLEDLRLAAGELDGELQMVVIGPGGVRHVGALFPASRLPAKYRRGADIQLRLQAPGQIDLGAFEPLEQGGNGSTERRD